jgi:hypothetical protein
VTGALPVYSPSNQWSYGPDCSTCYVDHYVGLSLGSTYGGSWYAYFSYLLRFCVAEHDSRHDTTLMVGAAPMSITLSFTGAFCTFIGVERR